MFVINKTKRRQKSKYYGEREKEAHEFIWRLLERPCSKRLSFYLKEIIPVLERFDDPFR